MLKRIIRVSAAVIMERGRILTAQRVTGEYAGCWEFPGGKQEEGETPRQALRREISEELGVQISTGQQIGTVEYDYGAFHLSMDCFICTLTEGQPEPKEHQNIAWVLPEELDTVEWLPADRMILDAVKHVAQGIVY